MKGIRGENQVRDLLRAHGFEATRNRLGAANDDLIHTVPGVSFEIKHQETWSLLSWLKQCEQQAGETKTGVLVFRKNGHPWRIVVDADHYLYLQARIIELEKQLKELTI